MVGLAVALILCNLISNVTIVIILCITLNKPLSSAVKSTFGNNKVTSEDDFVEATSDEIAAVFKKMNADITKDDDSVDNPVFKFTPDGDEVEDKESKKLKSVE